MKANKSHVILSSNKFPVVGIGASAGGLDAFKTLLKAIPEDSGMAYVLVQHLDPTHESMLPEILRKVTKVPVLEISDDIKVKPDHIYILPSNKMLVANDGVLQLSPRITKKYERNLPIDLFFTSLAEVHQSHAIGVVLSGTATDGTLGLKAIKEKGGLTFAQDGASSAYDGMPTSAVLAGVVDYILSPDKIPEKVIELTSHFFTDEANASNKHELNGDSLPDILTLLRMRKGTDFTYYKQTTIRRRILRRMSLHNFEDYAGYLKYLKENQLEQEVLFQDLLIPVTSFFRDPKTFDNLCETVLPQLLKGKKPNEPIRLWVAGCSSGQEAYSLAICFSEFLGNIEPLMTGRNIQIFASDINETNIIKARKGIYSNTELEGISSQRLNEYFIRSNEGYQLIKPIREMCVFAVHNFLTQPPFGKMDFISCRNVLIYMEPYLQKKALTTFHYALNPAGYLWLGKSETISSVPDLFSSASKKDKLFSRKDAPGRFMPTASLRNEQSLRNLQSVHRNENTRTDYQKLADEIMLRQYTPAGVVVNESMEIVHFRGATGNFLEQHAGKPSHNLLKMAKDGLGFELRNLLHKVKKEKAPSIKENIPIKVNGLPHTISIEVLPLTDTVDLHYLVLFHDHPSAGFSQDVEESDSRKKIVSAKVRSDARDIRIAQLEKELAQSRDDMRSITEDQEAVNEELQSVNEELMSGGEELQSLNEELESSKEELQSTNEELTIVNQEMISLNEQVTEAKEYAEAIVANIRTPLLVLDQHLRIRSANSAFYKTFQLNQNETEGKLIFRIAENDWEISSLRRLLEQILPEQSKIIDFEVSHKFQSIGMRTMLLNAHEIRTTHSHEKIILLSIEDITERTQHYNVLENEVRQRTIDLSDSNELLQQKYTELKSMNVELQSFNYISSHDLQEPLRKIQTFATHILNKESEVLSDKGKDYFKRMQDAANRMQELIENLLSYSRLSKNDGDLQYADLNSILVEVLTELNECILEKDAIIDADELCRVKVIPFQMRQLLKNLIANAVKFCSTERQARIGIKSNLAKGHLFSNDNLVPGKEYCHISVSDNGIGFDPEYKERVFELFERLHTKDEYPGTGIGLAIVKKIVDNHNGFITATSVLGKGTTFDMYFPAT